MIKYGQWKEEIIEEYSKQQKLISVFSVLKNVCVLFFFFFLNVPSASASLVSNILKNLNALVQ